MRLRLAAFACLASIFSGCSREAISGIPILPTDRRPLPYVNQSGAVNGWVTLPVLTHIPTGPNTVVGHDGALWSVVYTPPIYDVMRTDVNGNQTLFSLPSSFETSGEITPNPDGNLYYFVEDTSNNYKPYVGQITPQGQQLYFPTPDGAAFGPMISASDGNIWGVAQGPNSPPPFLLRMTTSGVFTVMNSSYTYGFSSLDGLVRGPDKNLWTVHGPDFIRISVGDGSVTLFSSPNNVSLGYIAEGSDGAMWASSEKIPHHPEQGLYRIDMAGNTLTYISTVDVADLVAGPNHMLYWGDNFKIHSFDELKKSLGRIITPPDGSVGFAQPLFMIGPDAQLWMTGETPATQNDAFVFLLHQLVATPSSVTVTVGSGASLSIVEKNSPQKDFTAVSNNPNVATVSGGGEHFTVTGVSIGSTSIAVSDKIGNSLNVPVTVE